MASDQVKIEFHPATWSDEAAADLARIAAHDEREIFAFQMQIEGGQFDLMDVCADGQRVGCIVWSIIREIDGPVMVINALAARVVDGVEVWREVDRSFREFSQAMGCRALRFWTKRPGLVRVAEGVGWDRAFYVMEAKHGV